MEDRMVGVFTLSHVRSHGARSRTQVCVGSGILMARILLVVWLGALGQAEQARLDDNIVSARLWTQRWQDRQWRRLHLSTLADHASTHRHHVVPCIDGILILPVILRQVGLGLLQEHLVVDDPLQMRHVRLVQLIQKSIFGLPCEVHFAEERCSVRRVCCRLW